MPTTFTERDEWLLSDGLGGFASGTAVGLRTRKYHAVLLASAAPPADRFVLVNGIEAWIELGGRRYDLSAQRYADGTLTGKDAIAAQVHFEFDPHPRWIFQITAPGLPGKPAKVLKLEQEIQTADGVPGTILRWRLSAPWPKGEPGPVLCLRPLLSGRDFHGLHFQNPTFRFDAEVKGDRVSWRAYGAVPGVTAITNAKYEHAPEWYRNFLYTEEQARGYDCREDLASPGLFRFDLSDQSKSGGECVMTLLADGVPADGPPVKRDAPAAAVFESIAARAAADHKARPTMLDRSAEAYIVRRSHDRGMTSSAKAAAGKAKFGRTIIAGYHWFADWGRDTFIAVRGLCIARGRLETARDILVRWSSEVRDGLLPNRFPDRGTEPEFNAIDASLWYVVAAGEYLDAAAKAGVLAHEDEDAIHAAMLAIVRGYIKGTKYNIRVDPDGLVSGGESGWQLTWMDAKVEGWVVTPRIGKPVEVQALWLNALDRVRQLDPKLNDWFWRGSEAFQSKFWNKSAGCLYDVIDENLRPGRVDATIRPNQIFAVGGLPLCLLDDARAKSVVGVVKDKLWTPLGPRSMAPGEYGYRWRYEGGVRDRDFAYHQGTVWPWLAGAFIEAWVRVHSAGQDLAEVKKRARAMFLPDLYEHLKHAGLGHVSEIADAEPPHTPRGCPFQAWSLGELLRLERLVLADDSAAAPKKVGAAVGT